MCYAILGRTTSDYERHGQVTSDKIKGFKMEIVKIWLSLVLLMLQSRYRFIDCSPEIPSGRQIIGHLHMGFFFMHLELIFIIPLIRTSILAVYSSTLVVGAFDS